VIGGSVVAVLGGILIIMGPAGQGTSTSSTAVTTASTAPAPAAGRATEVHACMVTHKMERAEVRMEIPPSNEVESADTLTTITDPYGRTGLGYIIFKRCDWPPPVWADPDGYSQVVVTTVFDEAVEEPPFIAVVDYVRSKCGKLRVSYGVEAAGDSRPIKPPIESEPHTVIDFDGKEWTKRPESPPEHDELAVLRPPRTRLAKVECLR
jgi:hypothetical protein